MNYRPSITDLLNMTDQEKQKLKEYWVSQCNNKLDEFICIVKPLLPKVSFKLVKSDEFNKYLYTFITKTFNTVTGYVKVSINSKYKITATWENYNLDSIFLEYGIQVENLLKEFNKR